jgi:uncharacterized protein
MQDRSLIRRFLGSRRIAFVGVSREPGAFSRRLMRDLLDRGYDMVPVNPHAREIEGRRCHPHVQDVEPPVEAALVMTAPDQTAGVVRDCEAAGVRLLWLHQGARRGSVSRRALALGRAFGLEIIPGACVYMHLESTGFVHRVHGLVRELFPWKRPAA